MSDQALVGPISLPSAQLWDGDSYAEDGEKLSLYGTEALIRQIRGLTGTIQKAQYGSMKILSSDNPWGPIWIDGSVNLKNNDNITHRGWYLLGTAEPKIEAPGIASLDANLELIAVDPHEILDIEYTPGINDDTDLDNNYPKLVQNTLFADIFDTLNNWDDLATALMTTHSAVASGGKLVFSGASDTDGKWGSEWIKSTPSVDGQNNLITVETDMEWVAKPTSGNNPHRMYFWINNKAVKDNWKGAVQLMLSVEYNRVSYRAQVIKQDGTPITVVPLTATTAQIIKWKFEETVGGYFNLYVDEGAGYIKKVTHMWTDIQPNWKGLYFMYGFWNMDSASATMKSSFLNVYSWTNGINNNIITGPVGATLGLSPDGTRTGEEGAIPYWVNPNSRITLQTTPANLYKGSVKAYNSNYTDGTPRLITNQHDILDPTKFYVKNGLIKLVTTTNTVQFWYWNGTAYVKLNEFNIGTINLIKPIYVGPFRATFQINMTKWTMWMGKPFVQVEHPTTDLVMNLAQIYNHDGITTTNPAVNADISMLTGNHCEIGVGNGLSLNQANCCEDGTTTGWAKLPTNGNAVLSPSTDWYVQGSKSLKVVCPGSVATEGEYTNPGFPIQTGQPYTWACVVHGTAGTSIVIALFDGGANGTGGWRSITTKSITLTGGNDVIIIPYTDTNLNAINCYAEIYHSSTSATTFYVDSCMNVPGTYSSLNWVAPGNMINQFNMQIFKQSPTTIKSNKIPADAITGIGFYDNTVDTSSYDHYTNLPKEWMIHPVQKIGIKQV